MCTKLLALGSGMHSFCEFGCYKWYQSFIQSTVRVPGSVSVFMGSTRTSIRYTFTCGLDVKILLVIVNTQKWTHAHGDTYLLVCVINTFCHIDVFAHKKLKMLNTGAAVEICINGTGFRQLG